MPNIQSQKIRTGETNEENRNAAKPEARINDSNHRERTFDLLIDGVPYSVKSVPFSFNGETRFKVSVNGDEGHVFTWDTETRTIRAIDDDSAVLPGGLEEAISERLQSR